MPAYRFAELTAYSVLRILPYILLMLYLFRGHLRLPRWAVGVAAALLCVARCLCGYVAYAQPEQLTSPNPGILILVALCLLMIKDHFGKTLFSLWMLANLSGLAVTLSKYLEYLLFGDMVLQLHRWTNAVTLFLAEAIVLVPVFFYIKHIYFKAVHQYTSRPYWRMLWLVPFTLYAVWYRNSYFGGENHELLAMDPSYVIFCLLVSGGGMVIYTVVAYLINEHAENDRLRDRDYLLTLQRTQYDNLTERIEEAREARHDLRQHLHMISAYLADQRYEELENYLSKLRAAVPETDTLVYCEHYAVNALLQYFAGVARQHGIGFSAQMALSSRIAIPDDTLTVLLGNLLENAVHACLGEPGAVISVRGKVKEGAVFFKIINTYTGKLKRTSEGLYLSTKHEGRGIGLRSVRGIVNEYRGLLKIRHEDGLFTVSLLLNLPE